MARRKVTGPRPVPNPLVAEMDQNAEERQNRAYRLWVLGFTFREIAKQCGYGSHQSAMRAVNRERSTVRTRDNAALVAQQADRIEYALSVVLDDIANGPRDKRLWAIDRLQPLLKRQAELLGLDAVVAAASSGSVSIEMVTPLNQALRGIPAPVEQAVQE